MIIDVNKIEWTLNNRNITAYRISKDSGVSQQLLGNYRNGMIEVESMSLKMAEKLSKVAQKYFYDEMGKAIRFIESGSADGVMLSKIYPVRELRAIVIDDLQSSEGERTLTGDDEDLKEILKDLESYDTGFAYVLETADPDFEQHVVPFDFDHMQELSQEFHSLPSLHKLLSGTADLLPDLN
ncbi:hypothetical protein [Lactobacillus sp. 3B(2020)]|uniref:hypothetical protein n=1 Tax=Lactobacillus sp. 3B(2020) TaxID=2695882 RepID=UPI0015DF7E09|nr:hypothetical protein [Lactobacillus sp. 3B(2020)]QLL69803.1 hypothetical protein GTO83_04260 [Lactobacillus sp. 3B(2020)]